MKGIRFLIIVFSVLSATFAGCTRDIVAPVQEEDGQRLNISVGNDFLTKSSVTSSGASQHIEQMFLFIFDGVTPDSRCFHAVDMGWVPVDGTGIPDFVYTLRNVGLDRYGKNDVTYLVVGVDNHPETYDIRFGGETVSLNDVEAAEGMSMTDVRAVLSEAAAGVDGTTGTLESKAWAMAHTELFSGVAVAKASDQTVNMTVERCVAGVLCYLTDIPYNVVSGEDSKIESIELVLNEKRTLNSSVSIPVDEDSSPEGADPISGSGGVVIASADLSPYTERQSDQGEKKDLLYIPATDDGTVKTLENSVLFGAYMVPIDVLDTGEGSTADATLQIVLRGALMPDGINHYERTYYVRNTAEHNDGTGTSHGVPVDGRDYNYSIQANRMYAIGSKPETGDTDGDKPQSLSGNILQLDVQEWIDVPDSTPEDGGNDADVQFPSYSLSATFQTDITPEDIFDCIGDTITVRILPAAGGEEWTLGIEPVGTVIPDWLSFRIGETADGATGNEEVVYGSWINDPTYIRTEGTKEVVWLQILINDHAVQNYIMGDNSLTMDEKVEALRNDYRTAVLYLTTAGNGADRETLTINQYNAITAPVWRQWDDYDEPGVVYRAFARDDLLKPAYDPLEYSENGYSYTGWGFYQRSPDYIFGIVHASDDNGEENCNNAYDYAHTGPSGNVDYYEGSAMFRGRLPWITKEHGSDVNNPNNRFWYTPARYELWGFFETVVQPLRNHFGVTVNGNIIDVVNVKYNLYYWTSTDYRGLREYQSFADKITSDGADESAMSRKNTSAYIRQARHFE